jgi:MYXO-CTERM domain-containing protein
MLRLIVTKFTSRLFFLLASLLLLLAVEGRANAAVGYVRSTVAAPWGSTSNEQAMDLAFGAGAWDDLRYETVNPATLFSATYSFVYLEGSDSNALELQAFLGANQAALEAWVSAGGRLLLNAGPNEGGNQAWGFGGVTLNNGDFPTDPGMAADPAHPIWNGPFLPTALMFTGSSYAHASVSGPGLVPLIIDSDGGNPNLAELPAFGSGRAIFGGLTTSNFWTPEPESLNLRANIIAYLAGGDSDGDGVSDALDNCPDDANPMQEDADMDGLGDACDDCPMDALNDADADMACDGTDNCVGLANPTQVDADMDGAGDECDPCPMDADDDIDADSLCADVDNCPDDANVNQSDTDVDGVGDLCDVCPNDDSNDVDGDGVCGLDDNCPDDANPDQEDADGNGVGDACDGPVGGSTGGDGTGGGGGSTGGGGTGGDDSGGNVSDTDGDTSGSGGGIPTGTGEGERGDDSGGCNCRTTQSGGDHPWWLLGLVALGIRRRRRAA